jgi:23S rRNA (pseudouridine1915-N3)-methyltransferase
MRIRVIAVGLRMPAWVDEAVTEYARRMPSDIAVEWRAVKAEPRHATGTAAQYKFREAQRIREALPSAARQVLLDERGADRDSADFAQRLSAWRHDARPVAIVIGGPDGLDASLHQTADETLRLSSLTLPHPLVRIVLAEQLYRAWSILSNHPYHRE